MRGEGVAQRVNSEPGVFVDLGEKCADRLLHRTHPDARASARDEHRMAVRFRADATKQIIATCLVVAQGEDRVIADRYDAFLSPFPSHLHLLRDHVEIAATQSLELGETHAGGVEQL